MTPLAPDNRTWLEWAADYHANFAAGQREVASTWKGNKAISSEATLEAEDHEAMSQACREAQG